jgi:hypothetical protein
LVSPAPLSQTLTFIKFLLTSLQIRWNKTYCRTKQSY